MMRGEGTLKREGGGDGGEGGREGRREGGVVFSSRELPSGVTLDPPRPPLPVIANKMFEIVSIYPENSGFAALI